MVQDTILLADRLIRRFRATFDRTPAWAWPHKPPIPLVGRRYRPGRGLLIYASAENLAWQKSKPPPARFTTEAAWNRYRVQYDRGDDTFFPDVGIQPVNDGGLLAAGLFIAQRLGLPAPPRPQGFLETVAVTNWCKFSIRSATNRDYIGDVGKLVWSLPYVVGELAVLQPAVVLLPAALWRRPVLAAAMRGASPLTRFLAAPQFNARVINCHLGAYGRPARRLRQRLAGTALAEWMSRLRGFRKEYAWRYIALLDALLGPQEKAKRQDRLRAPLPAPA